MASTQSSQEERIERLKALLTGASTNSRTTAALASSGEAGNLLLGVALHGADRARQGMTPTDLEQLMLDALATVVDEEERDAWGAAYRETVRTAAPGTLTVPKIIAERPASSGYAIADLEEMVPELTRQASEAPNVSLLSAQDLAEGSSGESEEFLAAMRERGFAVTGVTRYPDPDRRTRARAAASWRVKLEMDNCWARPRGGAWPSNSNLGPAAAAGQRARPAGFPPHTLPIVNGQRRDGARGLIPSRGR